MHVLIFCLIHSPLFVFVLSKSQFSTTSNTQCYLLFDSTENNWVKKVISSNAEDRVNMKYRKNVTCLVERYLFQPKLMFQIENELISPLGPLDTHSTFDYPLWIISAIFNFDECSLLQWLTSEVPHRIIFSTWKKNIPISEGDVVCIAADTGFESHRTGSECFQYAGNKTKLTYGFIL